MARHPQEAAGLIVRRGTSAQFTQLQDTRAGLVRTKTLWIRSECLAQILDGRKTIEVRIGYTNVSRLEPGDRLLLNGCYPFTIRRVSRYADFDELLAHEDAALVAPDLARPALLSALCTLYPPDKEALGAVALEIEPERAKPLRC